MTWHDMTWHDMTWHDMEVWNCCYFRQLRTWVHDNHCYLGIKSDTGQHSQFLRCFVFSPEIWWNRLWITFLQAISQDVLVHMKVRLKAVEKVDYVWQLSCTSSRPKPFIGLSCDLCWNVGGNWEMECGLVEEGGAYHGRGRGNRLLNSPLARAFFSTTSHDSSERVRPFLKRSKPWICL